MFNILWKSLRQGVETRPDPIADARPPVASGVPVLDASRCHGDMACVAACPTGAISLDTGADGVTRWKLDVGACLMCDRCVRACAHGAISLAPITKLASRDRGSLEDEVALPLPREAAS